MDNLTNKVALVTGASRGIGTAIAVDEISSVAVMLAANGYITGQTINVDGGWCLS
jgi:NAD(P)-dependent dehydrogenase (short-subunit alcohol dehydrogenase family)